MFKFSLSLCFDAACLYELNAVCPCFDSACLCLKLVCRCVLMQWVAFFEFSRLSVFWLSLSPGSFTFSKELTELCKIMAEKFAQSQQHIYKRASWAKSNNTYQ